MTGLSSSREGLDKWAGKLGKWGAGLSLGVTTPLTLLGKSALTAASDVEESLAKVGNVFEGNADDIVAWSNQSADAFGLSQGQALNAAGTFGNLFRSLGLGLQPATDMSKGIVKLGADLGSFNNIDPDVVLGKLRAGLTGEYEGLKDLGIALNENVVAQKAMIMTGKASAEQLTEAEKIQARYALITEQSSLAQDDFAETSGGLANQQRILNANVANMKASFGKIMLPLMLKATGVGLRMIKWLSNLSTTWKKVILVVLGFAAVLGPLLGIAGALAASISAIIGILPVLGTAFAVLTGPIGLIILAIAALAIAYKTNFLGFADAVNWVVDAIRGLVSLFTEAFASGTPVSEMVARFPGPLQAAAKGFLLIADAIGDLVAAFKSGGLSGLLDALPGELNQIWQGLQLLATEGFNALAGAISNIDWGAVWANVSDVGGGLLDKLGDLSVDIGTWAYNQFTGADWAAAWDGVVDVGGYLIDKLGDIAVRIGTWAWGQLTAVDWAAAWSGVVDIGKNLVSKLGTIALEVYNWAVDQFGDVDWAGAIGDLTTTLEQAGKDLLTGLSTGADLVWQTFRTWISNRGINIALAIGGLIKTLEQAGKDVLQGLANGAEATWKTFKTWVSNRKANIQLAIGSLLKTLYSHGKDTLQGLWDGAFDKWLEVSSWLGNLDSNIANAAGNLFDSLYSAGGDIMWGLASGITNSWHYVSGALQGIWDKIPNWFKKLSGAGSPAKKAFPMGEWVTWGIGVGMTKGIPHVERALGNVADAALTTLGTGAFESKISASMEPLGAQAMRPLAGVEGASQSKDKQRPVIQIFALKAEEYKDLLKKAEEGSEFARMFGQSLNYREA